MEKNMEMMETRKFANELIELATFYKSHLSKTSGNFNKEDLLFDLKQIIKRKICV